MYYIYYLFCIGPAWLVNACSSGAALKSSETVSQTGSIRPSTSSNQSVTSSLNTPVTTAGSGKLLTLLAFILLCLFLPNKHMLQEIMEKSGKSIIIINHSLLKRSNVRSTTLRSTIRKQIHCKIYNIIHTVHSTGTGSRGITNNTD